MDPQLTSLMGQVIDGTYFVESLIGTGGTGAVYRARHVRTEGTFAIKVLFADVCWDADLRRRFRREARISSLLRHSGIVQVLGFGELEDRRPYIVMEHLEGANLLEHMTRTGRFTVARTLRLARQLGSALYAAHRCGIVHRDLKPGNILLIEQDEGDAVSEQVKVIDFGMSRIRGLLGSEEVTCEHLIIGTPQYLSPEGARGENSQIDGRSDQFSMAVILYRMLTARLPFDGAHLGQTLERIVSAAPIPIGALRADAPPHMAAAIGRALSKAKEDRFPTVVEFVRALEGLAPQQVAPPSPPPERSGVVAVRFLPPSGETPRVLGPAAGPGRLRRIVLAGGGAVIAAALGLTALLGPPARPTEGPPSHREAPARSSILLPPPSEIPAEEPPPAGMKADLSRTSTSDGSLRGGPPGWRGRRARPRARDAHSWARSPVHGIRCARPHDRGAGERGVGAAGRP